MILRYYKHILLILTLSITPCTILHAQASFAEDLIIVGGGMAGAMEALFAYLDAKEKNLTIRIQIYDKIESILETTVTRIVPSLTCDEILSVVPRGSELVHTLGILFSNPGGIRIDDVEGIHASDATEQFMREVELYSLDEAGHNERTQALLRLGKMSMDLWQQLYDNADPELKQILELSNFNPCCEIADNNRMLHKGYRIDLIYNVSNARERAESMQQAYISLGYKNCALLTPQEVIQLDPFLTEFCMQHSTDNTWNTDAIALWRPGGCIDAQELLPQLYAYLTKMMGTYTDEDEQQKDCFQIHLGKKVTHLTFAHDTITDTTTIIGLNFSDGQASINDNAHYVFCPGESVGTLKKLGLCEPAYAGFAGASLMLTIDIPEDNIEDYATFSHCMEVHQEGVVLAWQARFKNNKIFIGVAGTKAFYSDQIPTKDQDFAKNRNLLQLNMINDVLPEFISLALGRDTHGELLAQRDLDYLESQGIAMRWVGTRAVVFDGFPSLGFVYQDNGPKIKNGRCATHLGSGGASFSPAVTLICRQAMNKTVDSFAECILAYGNSARVAKAVLI